MHRLVFLPFFSIATIKIPRATSFSVLPGVLLSNQDLNDEEQLARLLVQDASATERLPSTSRSVMTPGPNAHIAAGELLEIDVIGAKAQNVRTRKPQVEEDTLANTFLTKPNEEEDNTSLQLRSLPITKSRLENDKLAKYSQLRRAIHTKVVNEGLEPVRESTIEWMCNGCRTYNFIGRTSCRRCKQPDVGSLKHSLPPARHTPLFPTLWTCHLCGVLNCCDYDNANSRMKFYCMGCKERFSGVREWYCPSCHHINSRGSKQCATCYDERPHCWTCSSCQYKSNSIFFTECRNCHTSRPRRVSDSTILCPTCRQRNDVQWEMCFLCMTPLGMMHSVRKHAARVSCVVNSSTKAFCADTREEKAPCDVTRDVFPECGIAKATSVGLAETENAEKDVVAAFISKSQDVEKNKETKNEQTKQPELLVVEENTELQLLESNGKGTKSALFEDGTWWCVQCQVLHRRNVGFCDICLRPKAMASTLNTEPQKEKKKTRETRQDVLQLTACCDTHGNSCAASQPFSATGEWRCPYCRNLVDFMTTSCCGTPREITFGYWLCSTCCSINRDERGKCMGCGATPPKKPWNCLSCRFKNNVNDFLCVRCGCAHPHHWKCEKCSAKCQQALDKICTECGAAKPFAEAFTCPQCCASNNAYRKSCYRCHTRLSSDDWCCAYCGSADNEKRANRCNRCSSPREYNMAEIIWLCDVCNTGVASGGEFPERAHCPRCGAERGKSSLCFPKRWKCRSCGVTNLYVFSFCMECNSKRILENMHTYTTCLSCFRITPLTAQERCDNCGADLSRIITEAGDLVSLSGISPLLTAAGLAALPADAAELQTNAADGLAVDATIKETQNIPSFFPSSNANVLDVQTKKDHCLNQSVAGCGNSFIAKSVNFLANDGIMLSGKLGVTDNSLLSSSFVGGVNNDGANRDVEECDFTADVVEGALEAAGVDIDNNEWISDIPSWVCMNCETTNLEEADVCVCCSLLRGND